MDPSTDEETNATLAIQIAVHTLRNRCKNLQQHVARLEEENVNLRIECSRNQETRDSLSEVDTLRAQIAQLSEQKDQLQTKIKLVSNENLELWSKLGKLTRVNKSLGNQLSRISDTLSQHSPTSPTQTNLIRSKTFTKNEAHARIQKNLEENDKISLELEDISLKLSDTFSRQKREMEMLCSEITEMTFSNDELTTSNCGFLFDEEVDDDAFADLQVFSEDLINLKQVVMHQQTLLETNVKNLILFKDKLKNKPTKHEKSTETDVFLKVEKSTETDEPDKPSPKKTIDCTVGDRICPLCSKIFQKDVPFEIFEGHVEDHFVPDPDRFVLL